MLDIEKTTADVIDALRTVFDPEIPVNIYELGLIYSVEIDPWGNAKIDMTLTSPNCPEAQVLPARAREAALGVDGIIEADVQIVWDPPWSPDRMTEAAKLELGLM